MAKILYGHFLQVYYDLELPKKKKRCKDAYIESVIMPFMLRAKAQSDKDSMYITAAWREYCISIGDLKIWAVEDED